MAHQYKNERISRERIGVFTGWKDFAVEGCLPAGRMAYTLLGQVWSTPVRECVRVRVSERQERIAFAAAAALEYRPCEIGEKFGPTWSTYWFRVEVDLDASWAGEEVHLIWDSNTEAMAWTPEGCPIQGLVGCSGVCRRVELPLFDKVPPGGARRDLFIEVACNGLFGNGRGGLIEPPDPDSTFALGECGVSRFDRAAWSLLCDATFLEGCASNLSPAGSRRAQALNAANELVNAVRVEDRSTFDRGREIVAQFVGNKAVPPDLDPNARPTVFASGHCHIDTAWLWPYAETRRKCARSWSTQIRNMEKFPSYLFVCSQAQQFAWVKEDYPPLYKEVQEWVRKGRFIVTGGTWVEMDCNLPTGESLVRQFLEGQQFFHDEFGVECRVFWLPDTFGYSSQLPQVMRSAGIQYFLTQKLSWNLFNKFPHSTFEWEGLDGSTVIAHFPPADCYNAAANVDDVVRTASANKDRGSVSASMLLFGHGDGGGGANPAMLESITRMEGAVEGLPIVKLARPTEFFRRCEASRDKLPKWSGELYFELHRGTFTSQANIKKGNRRGELALRAAEMITACAAVRGFLVHSADYSADLKHLWRLLLLHQFHDTLPGSCIREVVGEVEKDHHTILSNCSDMTLDLMRSVVEGEARTRQRSSGPPREAATGFAYFKPHCFEQPAVVAEIPNSLWTSVREPDGIVQQTSGGHDATLVLVDELCPGIGVGMSPRLREKRLFSSPCSVDVMGDTIVLQNSLVRASMKRSGALHSLKLCAASLGGKVPVDFLDCSAGRFGNQLVLYDDISLFWDAWDVEVYNFEKHTVVGGATSCEVTETGPLRTAVRFQYEFGNGSTIQQTIYLEALSAVLTFENVVYWRENRKMLRVEFPTSLRSPNASFETQYGHVQRPTHSNTSWDAAKFEVCGHRFADLSESNRGLALLNDCKYGYAIRDRTMRLSLLRSPKSPDDLCDMGTHRFRYGLYPHAGSFPDSSVVRNAIVFNQPLVWYPSALGDLVAQSWLASYFELDDPDDGRPHRGGVVLDWIKVGEHCDDGSLILVRLYEALGGTEEVAMTFSTELNVREAFEVEITEHMPGKPLDLAASTWQRCRTSVRLNFSPFQLRSVLLRRSRHDAL